jgi:hypothetical protein
MEERISDQLVIRVKPSLRARLEQEARLFGVDLTKLARRKLDREEPIQPPQHEAA